MQSLKSALPPLEPLIAFEAAARHLSFTRAAQELNLSQAAVSQQIRNLETDLGIQLFVRSHRAVRLSTAGLEYQHTVSTALRELSAASTDLRTPNTAQTRLTLSTDQSIAALWLMSRLPRFQQAHTEIGVRLVASDDEKDCLLDDVQISILHGKGYWPGFECELLFSEEVFPVCSPDYLEKHPTIQTDLGLISEPLLELEDSHWDWMSWRQWLSQKEIHLPTEHRGFRVNSYPLLVEAAKNGQGVALGWRYLVDNELNQGRLVNPTGTSVTTSNGYFLIWPNKSELSDAAAAFRAWCRQELDGL